MLHATYFGPKGEITYQNKYVETEGYKLEKQRNKRAWLSTLDGDSNAVSMGYLFNQLRFGKVNKATCNTTIFEHAGRVFANSEADQPHEINLSDLSTIRVWDWNGEWDRPFGSHPKNHPETNELLIFGFAAMKPHFVTGIISADGERLVHKCDLELDRCCFSHDLGITERYALILHWPMFVDVDSLKKGGNLINFEPDQPARIGVMPHFGDVKSVKWFNVETNYTFHIVNSYEDGEEIVLHGCRSRVPLPFFIPTADRVDWFTRGLMPTRPEDAQDSAIDGALFTRIHEWRLNLKSGSVMERDLTADTFSLDMPRINDRYVGRKNVYAYADVIDDASMAVGMPKYGQLVKLYLTEKEGNYMKTELHDPGPNKFVSEPQFVARPGGTKEDDGWIVTYVHDEMTDLSEVHIIDAQKFSEPAVARILLPQRVPYGFHGTFVLARK